jgi:hypothetical protein
MPWTAIDEPRDYRVLEEAYSISCEWCLTAAVRGRRKLVEEGRPEADLCTRCAPRSTDSDKVARPEKY